MKKLFLAIICFLFISRVFCQTTADYAVQLSATVQTNPPLINLQWAADTNATSYTLHRKLKTATTWGAVVQTLLGSATQYTDTNVAAGISYEYQVYKTASNYTGAGYINSGIEVPETECRGRLILIIDSTYKSNLYAELKRLEQDLTGDGWLVIRHDVERNDAVTLIKNLIVSDYNAAPQNTKAVFLFGRIPVPYSGNINPDGHPEHLGAWPADVYYGEMNGVWTDAIVNSTSAQDSRNYNTPGDGKFDQSVIPSDIELQVGRVDFANLVSFSQTEETLLKNYLDKNHQYRHKQFSPVNRALIDDNFGAFGGEAFAASGWRNFPPLVGTANTDSADYISSLGSGSYIWSYGCGPGSPTSCAGVISTSGFVSDSLQSVFTILFGSYFGDWDYPDDLLRSALASGSTLASCWAGRPHWLFHHMALGGNIGYSTLLSQNNNSLYSYPYNNSARKIHIALIGDPSLRMYMIAPPGNLAATAAGSSVQLTWAAPADTVIGYQVYRLDTVSGCYNRIDSSAITGLNYVDVFPLNGINYYMVRSLKLETTPSGSFYNLSQGVFDTAQVSMGINELANSGNIIVYPNPTSGDLRFTIYDLRFTNAELEIFDVLGQDVFKSLILNPKSLIHLDLPDGIYFVKIIVGEKQIVKKIIICK